jgi:hypothetical protein
MIGGVIMFLGAYLWALEGNEGYHLHPEEDNGEAAVPAAKH